MQLRFLSTFLLLSLFSISTLHAQTGPQLYLIPFPEDTEVQSRNGAFSIFGNNTDSDQAIDIFYLWSDARGKLDKLNLPQIHLGYELHTLLIDSPSNVIPDALYNYNLGLSYEFGEIFTNWDLALTAGIGTANDGHFSNLQSYYGMGTLMLNYHLSPTQQVSVGVSFDGNRDIFPDVPLPFIQYYHFVSPQFQYVLGFYNQLNWKPNEQFQIKGGAGIMLGGQVIGADVRASYFPTKNFELFLNFDNSTEGFFQNNQGRTRLFYMYNIAGGGFAWNITKKIQFEAGAGFAFGQQFATGFDFRNLNTVVRPDDNVAVFLNLHADF
ncbi:hypothetical protein JD969_12205 [Planctomycetota bacterium]|nr:hypothetical protein JD969_12205 [Planctomycetota bacterium]